MTTARRLLHFFADIHACASSENNFVRGINSMYAPYFAKVMMFSQLVSFNTLHFSTKSSNYAAPLMPKTPA